MQKKNWMRFFLLPETFNMILTLGVFITLTVLNGCYLSEIWQKAEKQFACLYWGKNSAYLENDLEFAS